MTVPLSGSCTLAGQRVVVPGVVVAGVMVVRHRVPTCDTPSGTSRAPHRRFLNTKMGKIMKVIEIHRNS